MTGRTYSPLRYPGGKNCIFKFLSNLFYENNLIGIEYAEPYAGGAGLALHLLMDCFVSKIYINDLDDWVFSFWFTILNDTERFCDWIKTTDITVDNWILYKQKLTHPEKLSTFEKATVFFFLNRTNVSGVIKGGIIGGISQQGKYKIDARFNKNNLIERIKYIALFKNNIELSKLDGIDFLKVLNRKQRDIFFYIDPPYVEKGANLYLNFYNNNDHKNLAATIKKIRKKWLVSYDNNELISELYSQYRILKYDLSQCTSNRIGNELLVFSKEIEFSTSIQYLKNPVML